VARRGGGSRCALFVVSTRATSGIASVNPARVHELEALYAEQQRESEASPANTAGTAQLTDASRSPRSATSI
jgi:hypothetical protein